MLHLCVRNTADGVLTLVNHDMAILVTTISSSYDTKRGLVIELVFQVFLGIGRWPCHPSLFCGSGRSAPLPPNKFTKPSSLMSQELPFENRQRRLVEKKKAQLREAVT